MAGHDRAGTDKAVKARCVVACRGGARPVRAVRVGFGVVRYGTSRIGSRGVVWRGLMWYGTSRIGSRGKVRFAWARPGQAGQAGQSWKRQTRVLPSVG